MSDRTAANSTNDQGAPGDRNGARQTKSAGRENAREDTNGSPERRQIRQQEIDLNYYRKFLKDLVGVIRDSHSESVARIVSSFAPERQMRRSTSPFNASGRRAERHTLQLSILQ
ncbi:hypothetical protein N7491_003636 [Penicillium cf. griseofulvum]|nr:hypothetical protein N7491_003636 [Penicillium cf. griseofulvum]